MRTREHKRVWRLYTVADYDLEERWLNEMAAAGWNFERVQGGCRFTFRRGVPGEYIYKIDVVERAENDCVKDSRCNLQTEEGIRVVDSYKDWLYLEKRAADGPFDTSGDSYAQLRRLNKVYNFTILMVCRLLVVFTIVALACSVLSLLVTRTTLQELFGGISQGICGTALISLTLIWVPIVTRLRRRINLLVNEIKEGK